MIYVRHNCSWLLQAFSPCNLATISGPVGEFDRLDAVHQSWIGWGCFGHIIVQINQFAETSALASVVGLMTSSMCQEEVNKGLVLLLFKQLDTAVSLFTQETAAVVTSALGYLLLLVTLKVLESMHPTS